MPLPETIVVSPAEVIELQRKLSTMRHNINNQLALIVASLELIRRKPEMSAKLLDNISKQPDRIIIELRDFSDHFQKTLGVTESDASV